MDLVFNIINAYMWNLQKNRVTNIENRYTDTKQGREWGQLGDWGLINRVGCHFLPPRDLPGPGIAPSSLVSPARQVDLLPLGQLYSTGWKENGGPICL